MLSLKKRVIQKEENVTFLNFIAFFNNNLFDCPAYLRSDTFKNPPFSFILTI
jgi:hypothetical protein